MKYVFSIIQWVLTALAVVFVLVMASSYFPIPGNVKLFSVRSGSMEPTIPLGSLIIVTQAASYHPEDIITIRTPNPDTTVTHRIVAQTHEDGHTAFITKGDHNEENDTGSVVESDIIGTVRLAVPYIGYPVAFAQTPKGFILLIILPALLIILSEIFSIIETLRARRFPPFSPPSAVWVVPTAPPVSPPLRSHPAPHPPSVVTPSPIRKLPLGAPPRRRIV